MVTEGSMQVRLSPGNWIALAGLLVTLLIAAVALANSHFATKEGCASGNAALQVRIVSNETMDTYQTQELQRVNVQLENMDTRQRTINTNVEKLLERFRLEPAPQPAMKAVLAPAMLPTPAPAPAPSP